MDWLKSRRFKKISKQFGKFQTSIILALIGLVLIGAGLISTKIFSSKEEPTFVPAAQEAQSEDQIIVDVSGAVAKPGIYELKAAARVNDAIVKAGGFASAVDKVWVAKNINLAAKLTDGQKIYIPRVGESGIANGGSVASEIASKININDASESQLDSLPGIGPVRAGKIIANRPYSKIEDLLSKKVLGEGTFEKIKDKIAVY